MDRQELYKLCCDCKFADREKSGLPIGCLCDNPIITDMDCGSYTFWWTKPPVKERHWLRYVLIALGVVFVGIPLVIKGIVTFLGWIAPKVNKENLGLYLPGIRRR